MVLSVRSYHVKIIFTILILLFGGYLFSNLPNDINAESTRIYMTRETEIKLYTDPKGDVVDLFMNPINEPNIDLVEGWAWDNETILGIKLIVDGVIEDSNDVTYMINITNQQLSINYSVVYSAGSATFYYEDMTSKPVEFDTIGEVLTVYVPKSYMDLSNELAIVHGAVKQPDMFSFYWDESPLASYTMQTVTEPDFSIQVTPHYQQIVAGASVVFEVQLTALDVFNSIVELSAIVTPSTQEMIFNFAPTQLIPPGTSILSIDTSTTTPSANYTITVIGIGNSKSHSVEVNLEVTPAPDFSITIEPGSQSIVRGGIANYTITILPVNDFASSVTLSVTNLPPNTEALFDPNPIEPLDYHQSTLYITTRTTTPMGNYTFTVTGVGGGLTRNSSATLYINPHADFTIEVTPEYIEIYPGDTAQYNISIGSLYGFDAQVLLDVYGVCPNSDAVFSLNPVSCPGDTILEITTSIHTTPNTYTLTITGTSLGITHYINVTLVINDAQLLQPIIVLLSEVKFTPQSPVDNNTVVKISVIIENAGEIAVSDITVYFYLGDPSSGGSLIDTKTITQLSPGKTATVSIEWTADEVGRHDIFVKVSYPGGFKQVKGTIVVKSITGEGDYAVQKKDLKKREEIENLWMILLSLIALICIVVIGIWIVYKTRRKRGEREAGVVVPSPPPPSPPPVVPPPSQQPSPMPPTTIEEVFLIYSRDGRLISHGTRRLAPYTDADILSGMLTAVQAFVRDSFKSKEEGMLSEFKYGNLTISIERGRWVTLAVATKGSEPTAIRQKMRQIIYEIEYSLGRELQDWDGNISKLTLAPKIISKHFQLVRL